jgi:hypothetical protein
LEYEFQDLCETYIHHIQLRDYTGTLGVVWWITGLRISKTYTIRNLLCHLLPEIKSSDLKPSFSVMGIQDVRVMVENLYFKLHRFSRIVWSSS